ncbi:hypothetical protein HDV00_008337 [Rhizophlyctis rosea]|nr:hypothetical protein HDV00_008337 [Rhizophlyctis rosea]
MAPSTAPPYHSRALRVIAPLEAELEEAKDVSRKVAKTGFSVAKDFKQFLNRGNVVDMAVGIVMGSAFTAIVNSLVNDIFSPAVSTASQTGGLQYAFYIMRCPRLPNGTVINCSRTTWQTPTEARNAGAVTINWGNFIQTLINFFLISFIVFFLVKAYTATFRREEKKEPNTKPCDFCTKDIPKAAKKCPNCTADLPPSKPATPAEKPPEEETKVEEFDDHGEDEKKEGARRKSVPHRPPPPMMQVRTPEKRSQTWK